MKIMEQQWKQSFLRKRKERCSFSLGQVHFKNCYQTEEFMSIHFVVPDEKSVSIYGYASICGSIKKLTQLNQKRPLPWYQERLWELYVKGWMNDSMIVGLMSFLLK